MDYPTAVKELKTLKDEYHKYSNMMTDYEQSVYQRGIREKRDALRPVIEGAAIGQHAEAISNLKAKLAAVEVEQRKVINSWDAGKLAAEMQVYSMRIDAAAKTGDRATLEAIYNEAQQSGDRYKQRAAAETLRATVQKIPADAADIHGESVRKAVNRLEVAAGRDLEALQTSPELQAAHQAAALAVDSLNEAGKEITRTADLMDEVYPNGTLANSNFINALQRVRVDEGGNFQFKE